MGHGPVRGAGWLQQLVRADTVRKMTIDGRTAMGSGTKGDGDSHFRPLLALLQPLERIEQPTKRPQRWNAGNAFAIVLLLVTALYSAFFRDLLRPPHFDFGFFLLFFFFFFFCFFQGFDLLNVAIWAGLSFLRINYFIFSWPVSRPCIWLLDRKCTSFHE